MGSTIGDVAREAGVSIATVSRVINKTDNVRSETALKVTRAAAKLRFYPDRGARALVSKRTRSVGLLVPTLLNEYWASFCESVQGALLRHDYSLFLGTLDGASSDYLERMLRSVVERRMDGLIIGAQRPNGPSHVGRDAVIKGQDEYVERRVRSILEHVRLPVVSFNQTLEGFSSVMGDHEMGGEAAARLLLSLGHRDFAFIGGDPDHFGEHDPRERGFRRVLAQQGIHLDPRLVRYVPFGIESGYAAAGELLDEGLKLTALFCWNDQLSAGALNCLVDRGVSVPGAVSVVGFDDIGLARVTRPALTTIRQPLKAMGEITVRLLLDAMESEGPATPMKVMLPTELVVRGSTGVAPIS